MYGKLKEFLTNELEASKPLVYTRTSVSYYATESRHQSKCRK